MTTTSIQTLKPNVSQDEALRKFSSPGLGTLYRRVRIGPLRRIAGVYVPFFLYRVRYQLGRAPQTRFFAMDAVDGSLDLFEFPGVPGGCAARSRWRRGIVLRPALSGQRAEELLRDKVLRVIFQQGFLQVARIQSRHARVSPSTCIFPIGWPFTGTRLARCRVMDAVRRRIEGAKASAFFEEWLAA